MADGMIAVAGTVVAPGDIVAVGIVVVTASGVQSLDSGLSTAAGGLVTMIYIPSYC